MKYDVDWFQGSSPLTRGKPEVCDVASIDCRLIPAHAGKTLWCLSCGALARAHPRSRGENMPCPSPAWTQPGSSPLTRGKPGHTSGIPLVCGLIPAHAGKTDCSHKIKTPRGAHPRSRGENASIVSPLSVGTGSSPLTRGKRDELHPVHAVLRLIPAHAGKTTWCAWSCARARAHPRSRGENSNSTP